MARSLFTGRGGDFAIQDPAGNSGIVKVNPNLTQTGTFWSARTGGTQYTDLRDGAGNPISGLSTNASGYIVTFQGPDAVTSGWADFGAARILLEASDGSAGSSPALIDTTTAANLANVTSATRVSVNGLFAAERVAGEVRSKVKTDGTDQTATFNAEIASLQTFGGGTIEYPTGIIRIDGRIDIPYTLDGTGAPIQPSLHLKGTGRQAHGRGSGISFTPSGGTVFDLRWADADLSKAKLLSRGFGNLEISGITFTDTAGGANPFIRHTNTTVTIHDVSAIGTKVGVLCNQDFILAGGQTVPGAGDFGLVDDSPYQGYGSTYRNIWHNGIRRAIVGGLYFNNAVIDTVTGWSKSGNATGGMIEIDPGGTTVFVFGVSIANTLCEAASYKYVLKLRRVIQCSIGNLGVYDMTGSATFVSSIYLDTCSVMTVVRGFDDNTGGFPFITVATGTWQDYVSIVNGSTPSWSFPMTLWGSTTVRNSGGGSGAQLLFARAADATTGNQVSLSNFGTTWGYPGQSGTNMRIDTGTGGSYLETLAYQQHWYTQAGVLYAKFGQGLGESGKPGFLFDIAGAFPPGIYGVATPTIGGIMSIKAGDVFRSGRAATAGRPSAVNATAGAMFYDTTLNKPIWSDGSVWRDAAGTVV